MTAELTITAKERIVYSLNVEDLQHVAHEELGRELTEEEINYVEDKVGEYISWHEAISFAIHDLIHDNGKGNLS